MIDVVSSPINLDQGASINDKQSSDGFYNKFINFWKKKKKGDYISTDPERTYSHVNWIFVRSPLGKMGFGTRWRARIVECTPSTTFSMDGSLTHLFNASRNQANGPNLALFFIHYSCRWLVLVPKRPQILVSLI